MRPSPLGKTGTNASTGRPPFYGVKAATEYSKMCVQGPDVEEQGEDCLTFNVYRTKGIPLSRKLPVLVWIHGGAFISGGWHDFDGASFVASSSSPIMVVTFHYRLNAFGFLPSTLFEDEGIQNLGLQDQYFFLKSFVQRHITSFGGDRRAVTLGGRSAGAHSVGMNYFHNYGEDANEPYFARAIHQSGSVTARAFPNATYPLYVSQFGKFMENLNCATQSNAEAMACLRSATVEDIQTVGLKLYLDSTDAITWPFQPAQGGPMLEKPGSESGYDGTYYKVPTITTTVTDEGKAYVPGGLETTEEFIGFLHNIAPALDEDDLARLKILYPDQPSISSSSSENGTQYERLAAAYSDYALICPGQETAYRASIEGVPTWKARFNTNNSFPAWQGIPHGGDEQYTWNEPLGVQYPDISEVYHAYLSSFVATGDPNTYRYPGTPEWPRYEPSGYGMGSEPALQLVIQPQNETGVELDNIRRDACLYWRDPERAPRLNK